MMLIYFRFYLKDAKSFQNISSIFYRKYPWVCFTRNFYLNINSRIFSYTQVQIYNSSSFYWQTKTLSLKVSRMQMNELQTYKMRTICWHIRVQCSIFYRKYMCYIFVKFVKVYHTWNLRWDNCILAYNVMSDKSNDHLYHYVYFIVLLLQ